MLLISNYKPYNLNRNILHTPLAGDSTLIYYTDGFVPVFTGLSTLTKTNTSVDPLADLKPQQAY